MIQYYPCRIILLRMTGSEVRRIRKRLGLTQVAFADLVGVHSNSLARWERDELKVHESAARLMKLLAVQKPPTKRRRKPGV